MKRQPHARPMPRPRLVQCGRPECRICSANGPSEPPDSGHPAGEESLASLLVGAAFIVMALAFVLFLLPALAIRP